MDSGSLKKEVASILQWYSAHGRDLPWRKTRDPYRILVSEVMLQQTQVDRVIPKYHAFLHRFPTVEILARAKPSSVITQWAGLGYNRRALYLQKTAQAIVHEYKGKFPKQIDVLKRLPGIGDYTARAILSFAFEQKVPMMDTNHRQFYTRVLCHNRAVSDEVLLKKAEGMIAHLTGKQTYCWNQALMDLMSAVGQGSSDPFTVAFEKKFPGIKKRQTFQKKKIIPFKKTDRYVRGRIIDVLREKKMCTTDMLTAQFLDFSSERLDGIIRKLEKDGLIKFGKRGMMLP